MITFEQLTKTLDRAFELKLIDALSYNTKEGEFDRDIYFTVIRDEKSYKISWWCNIAYLYIGDSFRLSFDDLEVSSTWPNHFKTNLQFEYYGNTCAIIGLEEYPKGINNMSNIYHPKGSMCAVCRNKSLDCSKALDFKFMPVMGQYSLLGDEKVYKIVKCLMFNKLENKDE